MKQRNVAASSRALVAGFTPPIWLCLSLVWGLLSPVPAYTCSGGSERGVSFDPTKGLLLCSEAYEVRLGGRLLLDTSTFDGAFNAQQEGQTSSEESVRSAMVDVLARRGNFSFFVQYAIDVQRFVLAFATYKGWADLDLVAGKQKEPLGLDYQSSSRYLATLERPLVQALVPGVSLGAMARGQTETLTYAGGAFHKETTNENGVTARLTWVPVQNANRVVHTGVAVSRRRHGGRPLEPTSRGEVRMASTRVGQTTAVEAERATVVGLELATVHGPLSLQAEAVLQQVEATRPGNDVRYSGFYVQASYFLTGESRGYSFERGRFGPTQLQSKSGAIEVVTRYSQLDLDGGNPGTRVRNLTLGANWHLNERLRLMANYINTNIRGRGASQAVAGFHRGDAITLRVQILI